MKIIRSDTIGTIDMKLIRRPTNTAVGLDNFIIVADGRANAFPCPIVRFLSTNPSVAARLYNDALEAAQAVYGDQRP